MGVGPRLFYSIHYLQASYRRLLCRLQLSGHDDHPKEQKEQSYISKAVRTTSEVRRMAEGRVRRSETPSTDCDTTFAHMYMLAVIPVRSVENM